MRVWLAIGCLVCALAGCGRLRYEERACPQGTAEIESEDGDGSSFCIDIAQTEEQMSYLMTVDYCAGLDMRLCTDLEWYTACIADPSLDRMTDDWEWVEDLVDETTAMKRGGGGCDAMSTHDITSDPYGVRCCSDR